MDGSGEGVSAYPKRIRILTPAAAIVGAFRFRVGGNDGAGTTARFGSISVSEFEVVRSLKTGDHIVLCGKSNRPEYDHLPVN